MKVKELIKILYTTISKRQESNFDDPIFLKRIFEDDYEVEINGDFLYFFKIHENGTKEYREKISFGENKNSPTIKYKGLKEMRYDGSDQIIDWPEKDVDFVGFR